MKSIDDLARERNTARAKVRDWMAAEGTAGNLRTNGQAPAWAEYEAAEKALDAAVNVAGVNPAAAD